MPQTLNPKTMNNKVFNPKALHCDHARIQASKLWLTMNRAAKQKEPTCYKLPKHSSGIIVQGLRGLGLGVRNSKVCRVHIHLTDLASTQRSGLRIYRKRFSDP